MISYQSLAAKPRVFKSVTGLDRDEFDRLFQKFLPAWVTHERERLDRPDRQRAIGGGRKYKLLLQDRLVMVLTWLRWYLNTEALGFFFDLQGWFIFQLRSVDTFSHLKNSCHSRDQFRAEQSLWRCGRWRLSVTRHGHVELGPEQLLQRFG